MIRTVILASLLAFAGSCIDQEQPDVGTTDQGLTLCVVGTPCYSNIFPTPWNDRAFTSVWDYWAPPPVSTTALTPNLQMVAFVVNGAPAVLDPASGATLTPATRLVWLISNRGVYRVYEVNVSDVAEMTQITRNAFTVVENSYAVAGYASPGSTIIVGVDGGVVIPPKGGPPRGYPASVVTTMTNLAATVRPVIVNVQNAVYMD